MPVASLRYRAMNGTVAPPSSSSTAAVTCRSRTPSSSAMRCCTEIVTGSHCAPTTSVGELPGGGFLRLLAQDSLGDGEGGVGRRYATVDRALQEDLGDLVR